MTKQQKQPTKQADENKEITAQMVQEILENTNVGLRMLAKAINELSQMTVSLYQIASNGQQQYNSLNNLAIEQAAKLATYEALEKEKDKAEVANVVEDKKEQEIIEEAK